ncbi:hypothetical protein DY218_27175 [Streptomyces triticagri]|uniref:Uncharacterized protein n=1 Tax=Streptomyces triticagri TaxID=2293568 RepID=A0A372LZ98_9ACTN|nr:hypothetical protein [Streptomyces triticagri]RFU83593.1 hypothetical protein DY218_27175 [Streptomyces triticagri]
MPASKAKQAEVALRRSKAIRMRLSGADYETIATDLGYASRGAACTDISRALKTWREQEQQDAEELVQVESLRLEHLQAALWPAALAGEIKAVEASLKIMDRRARLLGLDRPGKVAVEGVPGGAPIALAGPMGEAERLAELQAVVAQIAPDAGALADIDPVDLEGDQ